MEFADLLVKFRDKLNDLYKSKNKDNIKNICEQYIDTLNVLHKIIQQNKIYNNYEINLGCSVDNFFYMSKNDFNDIQYDDENKKTQYYQIPRKLLRIQNARCVLQNYTNYDPNNINNNSNMNPWLLWNGTEEPDLKNLPDNIHSNYTKLLNVMM